MNTSADNHLPASRLPPGHSDATGAIRLLRATEGFNDFCNALLKNLVCSFWDYLNKSESVVGFDVVNCLRLIKNSRITFSISSVGHVLESFQTDCVHPQSVMVGRFAGTGNTFAITPFLRKVPHPYAERPFIWENMASLGHA